MENYLMLNDKRINLTDAQVAEIKKSFVTGNTKLADKKETETFKIGEYEFFVLEQLEGKTVVLLKDLLHTDELFGSNNNYAGSNVDELCIKFGEVIENLVGADNLIEHTVDLTADDGLKCYGSVERKMSLLTANQYRKYVYAIDEHKIDKWWWLATAYSTAKHDDTDWIKCVSPVGCVYDNFCSLNSGVRPFCILKSDIFVS